MLYFQINIFYVLSYSTTFSADSNSAQEIIIVYAMKGFPCSSTTVITACN